MKRVLLVLVLALATFTAKAQFYVGGSLGLNDKPAYSIAPEVGFNLNNNMTVGCVLSWKNEGDNEGDEYVFAPYFRYYLVDIGPARIFCDALLELASFEKDKQSTSSFGIGVAPGIAFPLNDHFYLAGRLGRIGLFNNRYCLQLFPSDCGSSLGLYFVF